MQGLNMLLVALLATAAAREVQQSSVTPVQKVIAMMEDMKTKGLDAKQAETATFTEFKQFCHNTQRDKSAAIETGKGLADQLSADAMKYDSDATVLSQEIKKLDAEMDAVNGDMNAAIDLRGQEKADYSAAHSDYVESTSSLAVAISKVKSMMSKVGGASAASLLQTLAAKPQMPSHARRVLASFISKGVDNGKEIYEPAEYDGRGVSAPEAHTFESQSGGIVSMMEGLASKLSDEKTTLEKEEADKQHAHDRMVQGFTDTIEQKSETRSTKAGDMKAKEEASATAKGDLADTQNTLAEDSKYLADTNVLCAQKSADFAARQKLRDEEVEALNKAIDIISGGAVSGSADKHLPGLLQQPAALVQLRSSSNAERKQSQARASSFLEAQAKKFKSHLLSMVAVKVHDDALGKVKKMIEAMVVKLMEEANEEADHKGFCDTEMKTNQQTRDQKSSLADKLTAQIAEMEADSKKLASEVAGLSDEISASDGAVAEATKIRAEESEKNAGTIADAKAAINAVSQATTVLREFYEKAAAATALVQEQGMEQGDALSEMKDAMGNGPADAPAALVGSAGGSLGGSSTGVLGMLEVILSDFQRLESSTTEGEATSQREFEMFSADSSKDKAVKNVDIKHKQNRGTELDSKVQVAKGDLKSTQEELDAAMAYYEKLKPSCVDAGETYEERVARRNEEIESLKGALEILSQ